MSYNFSAPLFYFVIVISEFPMNNIHKIIQCVDNGLLQQNIQFYCSQYIYYLKKKKKKLSYIDAISCLVPADNLHEPPHQRPVLLCIHLNSATTITLTNGFCNDISHAKIDYSIYFYFYLFTLVAFITDLLFPPAL